MTVDPGNGDVYVADGYGNHRVVVFDKAGSYLRQWGSSGTGPGQFQPTDGGHPHCVVLGNDGLVYTCDRGSDRLQVFDKFGNLQRIIPVKPGTGVGGLGTAGSAWDVDFSPDRFQTFMFDADGGNEIVWTFDRAAATILSGFGRPGHQAGDFTYLHTVSVDSKGHLYTGETINGRRIQRWVRAGADGGQ
jgi:DNA-binding beta-propeller fold protein YncE